jgi:hypothetical protein
MKHHTLYDDPSLIYEPVSAFRARKAFPTAGDRKRKDEENARKLSTRDTRHEKLRR